ncbi:MAG: VWA domain-containing protein, partial [Thermoguttaceae bacterium]|nr:VWA domain-containing protein [Thermoguttaceae bacterium]
LARTLLAERDAALLRGIQENYRLRVYFLTGKRLSESSTAGEVLEAIGSTEPAGDSTRLGAAVRAVLDDLRGMPPAAIVLLTDGINTEGPTLIEGASHARRRGVPLYLVGLGDDRPVRDIQLSGLLVDETVFVDDLVYFEAQLKATGYEGKSVRVVLREQGKPQVLAEQPITLGPGRTVQQVRLAWRPKQEGEFHYVVEAEPLEGELQTDNNRQERTVRVRKEKIRVLLVYAEPSFEFRYLENMLGRDESIELKTVLQNADLDHSAQSRTALRGFPVQRDELFRYDVVILGDAQPASPGDVGSTGLTPAMLESLVEFVQAPDKGGTLVCIAGPRYMPLAYRETALARLLPIDVSTARVPDPALPLTEGFRVQPTELGLASPALQIGETPAESAAAWKNLPPLYWFLEAQDVKPGARILAEHPTRQGHDGRPLPLILMHYVGAGKVLFHAIDETWRWRFRVGDTYFARYWVQTIRYLARSKLDTAGRAATLSTQRREYRFGEPVRLTVRFADERLSPEADDGVTVLVEHQAGKIDRVTLRRNALRRGTFEAVLAGPAVGSYHVSMVLPKLDGPPPATDFTVSAPPGEFARIEADTRTMQRAAELSRGRYYTFATADRLVEELPEGHEVPVETLPPKPLWNTWPVLVSVLLLLITEWILRKLGGMA